MHNQHLQKIIILILELFILTHIVTSDDSISTTTYEQVSQDTFKILGHACHQSSTYTTLDRWTRTTCAADCKVTFGASHCSGFVYDDGECYVCGEDLVTDMEELDSLPDTTGYYLKKGRTSSDLYETVYILY